VKWRKGRNKKNKTPTRKKEPPGGKRPRKDEAPENFQIRRIQWRLSAVDTDGPWSVLNIDPTFLVKILLPRLKAWESMTWGEADGQKSNHTVAVYKICSAARKRITEIEQDDTDDLYSMNVAGKVRLWGIRDRAALRILWWDPDHTVYPVEKKYT